MAQKQDKRLRASNGRFVKKWGSASKGSAPAAGVSSDHIERVRSEAPPAREGTVALAILALAIVVAVLGFAVHFLWIGALVLMGVLWGLMVAERQQRQGTVKGLAAEIVTTVVDEAKGVMDAASGSGTDGVTPPSQGVSVQKEER